VVPETRNQLEPETMISTDTFQRPHFHANRASAHPGCCQQAQRALIVLRQLRHKAILQNLIVLRQLRHKAILQNLIDQVINAGFIALVGCSIAAALAIGAPVSTGGPQTAMPTLEWRPPFDQRVFRASSHEPRMQHLVGTVSAPIGQGWG
jgi:hypothetical protein